MNAAIYARESSAKENGHTDEASVARQLATARAFATARGWAVADAHAYSDHGVSGAEFARRPGLCASWRR
jgi:DNA invertase Pin-like site-specific DNA recombinase